MMSDWRDTVPWDRVPPTFAGQLNRVSTLAALLDGGTIVWELEQTPQQIVEILVEGILQPGL